MPMRCIIVGNGGTLAQWAGPMPHCDIIATNQTWSWHTPQLIITTRPEARTHIPIELLDRVKHCDHWASSGAAALEWASQQHYEEIICLGFDTAIQDITATRCYDYSGTRHNYVWREQYREVILIYPSLLKKINPGITREQQQRIYTSTGLYNLELA